MRLMPSKIQQKFVPFRFCIYLLLLITASIYLRSVFGQFISLDDHHLVARLRNTPEFDFYQLFFGEGQGGLYYRPLLMATHYAEMLFLAIDPVVMRLNNVLLHLANTLWICLIVQKIYALRGREAHGWPLLWALLFGLHPLATESANWISGRTDLLAGFFVFAATWLALLYREGRSPIALGTAFLCAFCAMLSKEVAVAFLPGLFLLLWAPISDRSQAAQSKVVHFYRPIGIGLCFGLALLAFVHLRSLLIETNSSSIGRTISIFFDDFTYSAMLFFRLFGFYAKKIVAPWPLNLAIIEVDPLYDLLGVLVVLLLVWLFFRNRFTTDFFVIAALLLLPAYPISFNQVAWTPYAERYAYIAAAFVILGCAALSADRLRTLPSRAGTAACIILLLLLYAPTTYARNGIWQSSLTLWADTVAKSPLSLESHTYYAVELYKSGDFEKAEVHFNLARAGSGYSYSPENGIRYAEFLTRTGRRPEAVSALQEVVARTGGKSQEALIALVTLCSRSQFMIEACGGSQHVDADFDQLYNLTSDPVWLHKRIDFNSETGQGRSTQR